MQYILSIKLVGIELRTVQELLGDSDVSTALFKTHVLKVAVEDRAILLDEVAHGH